MLLSIALIFTLGLMLGEIFRKLNLPGFIGMIITGVILGPYVLDLIFADIMNISSDLRTIALVIILLRAGLSLDISDLKKIGRPAILMAFLPATVELIVVVVFAPMLFDMTYLEAAILGSVLAAVSPAVVVPKMIYLMQHKYGEAKKIPQMILAAASVDDIYVIVLFTIFTPMYVSGDASLSGFLLLPVAIVVGVLIGILIGILLSLFFSLFRVRDTIKVLLILAVSLFFVAYEQDINQVIPFSALLGIMVIGIVFLNQSEERALRLRDKFSKVWVLAELLLFVLVGAAVDVSVAWGAGLLALVLLAVQLTMRFGAVQLSLLKTSLNQKERFFSGLAYLPKATVQASIGAIPLMLGVPSGDLILAIAVLSIIVTAPVGAIAMDLTHKRFLQKG